MKTVTSIILLILPLALFSQVPTITSFNPTSGVTGSSITVVGENFDPTPENNQVFFGATEATVLEASSTEILVSVPECATHDPMSIIVNELVAYSVFPFVVEFGGTELDQGSFYSKSEKPTGERPYSSCYGDFDGDGITDLAVVNVISNTMSVFLNNNSEIQSLSFTDKSDYNTGTSPWELVAGDLDNDGKLDIVVVNFTSNTASVFRNSSESMGSIAFESKIDFTTGLDPKAIAIGDLDNDGKTDLAIANSDNSSISILRNISSGIGTIDFETKVDFEAGFRPRSISIGDLDGDRKLDLVSTNEDGIVSIFRNNSSAIGLISFESALEYQTNRWAVSSLISDFDNDGMNDIAVACTTGDIMSIYRNSGDNIGIISFENKLDFSTGLGPIDISAGDLNGDGKVDIVVTNWDDSSISVFENNSLEIGDVSFTDRIDFTTDINPHSVSICDLDRDSKPELVVTNSVNDYISIFKNINNPNSETLMVSFSIDQQISNTVIDPINNSIDIEVSVDATEIVPSFVLSQGATAYVDGVEQISTITAIDLTSPVTYTIIAEDQLTSQDWVVRNSRVLGLRNNISNMTVYPNPFIDQLTINSEDFSEADIQDLSGRKILISDKNVLNLDELPSGLYILTVLSRSNEQIQFRVIKE